MLVGLLTATTCALPLTARPPPLLCVTTAASLEGVAFCERALRTPNEFRVRALVRNPDSSRAQRLKELGAEVVVADNREVESLVKAFDGADGVYACTTWSGSGFTADGTVKRSDDLDPTFLEESEVEQGLNILAAAERTPSLSHFVLQSMHRPGRTNYDHSVPAPLHHRAKWRQEAALQASTDLSCSWTILRQPTYLENFANDETAAQGTALRLLRPGLVSGLLGPEEALTVISVSDLGALAVALLREGPDAHDQRILAAGSERITGSRLASAAARVHGAADFEYRQVPSFVLEYLIPVDYPKQLARWLSKGGNDEGVVDHAREESFAMCKRLHPEMLSVEDWLVKQGVRELPVPKVQVLQKGVAAMLQRLMREDNPLIEGQGGEQRLDRRAALGLALSTAWGAGSVLPALLQPQQPRLPSYLLASEKETRSSFGRL